MMRTQETKNLYTDPDMQCLLNRVADKWTTLIIGLLESEPRRYGQLRREIDGISQKMLTQTLRELERNGIVQRTVFAQVPPRVEYALTPLGRTLCKPLAALRQWTLEYRAEVVKAREEYDERLSGEEAAKG